MDSIKELKNEAQEAINRLNDVYEDENGSCAHFIGDPQDSFIEAARRMIWKIAASGLVDSPQKIIVVGKLFRVFQNFPNATLDENLSLNLVGPHRMYGDHEIYHFWNIELREEGDLRISAAGHFYRPSTGGDSFTSMTWEASPGYEPELSNYLQTLQIVDDADTFEHEVEAMDLESGGYELSVEDPTLEEWAEEDVDTED